MLLIYGSVPSAVAKDVKGRSGNYVVQLNAFTVEANAQKFIRKFKLKGYPVFLDHKNGERWFKIRVGPFGNWEEARQISLNFKKQEKLSPLVLLTLRKESKPAEFITGSPAQPKEKEVEEPSAAVLNPVKNREHPADGIQEESDSVDRVIARFMQWKTAWQEKDLSTYLQFYSSDFDSGSKSPSAWQRSRAKALARKGQIMIDVAEVQIQPDGGEVEMSFIQKFKSGGFSDVGHKTLIWRLENGYWAIVSERWFPI